MAAFLNSLARLSRTRSLAFATLALVVLGCSPRPVTSPQSALTAYTEAIEEDRLEDAYILLSAESRADLSLKQFQELVRSNPEEVAALLKAAAQEEHPPLVTAEFETPSGQILHLIYENGAWRIDQSAVNLYDQTEPRTAMQAFVRAYDAKRFDILLRFVPKTQSEGLTEAILQAAWEGEQRSEIEQLVEELRAHVKTADLEVVGDRATMSYGAGGVVELVREQADWKIEDLK